MTCSTCANRGCPSCTTPPPPGQTYSSWAVLLRVCRQLDDRHNFGAGKPRLTSGNDCERGFDRGTIRGTETSGPGGASTPRDPDGSPKEAPAVPDDTEFVCPCRICPRCQWVDPDEDDRPHPEDGLAGPCGRCSNFEWWAVAGPHMDGRCPTTADEHGAWVDHDTAVMEGRA